MHHVRQHDIPVVGSTHQFVGADQGDVTLRPRRVAARQSGSGQLRAYSDSHILER